MPRSPLGHRMTCDESDETTGHKPRKKEDHLARQHGRNPPRDDHRRPASPAADLAAETGPTWTADELTRDFEVISFAAPYVVVRRRSDGAVGNPEFTHFPRVYFGWRADA
jgi:hypothetical protein